MSTHLDHKITYWLNVSFLACEYLTLQQCQTQDSAYTPHKQTYKEISNKNNIIINIIIIHCTSVPTIFSLAYSNIRLILEISTTYKLATL